REGTPDQRPELVVPDPPDPAHPLPQPGQPDRQVALRATDRYPHGVRVPQQPDLRRRQQRHRLGEGVHLGHAGTAFTSSVARAVGAVRSPPSSASPISVPPTPTATAPAANQSATFCALTPPVGTIGMSGNGSRMSRRYRGPPSRAGNSLTAAAPAAHAATISVGVNAPGRYAAPRCRTRAASAGSVCGDTR